MLLPSYGLDKTQIIPAKEFENRKNLEMSQELSQNLDNSFFKKEIDITQNKRIVRDLEQKIIRPLERRVKKKM